MVFPLGRGVFTLGRDLHWHRTPESEAFILQALGPSGMSQTVGARPSLEYKADNYSKPSTAHSVHPPVGFALCGCFSSFGWEHGMTVYHPSTVHFHSFCVRPGLACQNPFIVNTYVILCSSRRMHTKEYMHWRVHHPFTVCGWRNAMLLTILRLFWGDPVCIIVCYIWMHKHTRQYSDLKRGWSIWVDNISGLANLIWNVIL